LMAVITNYEIANNMEYRRYDFNSNLKQPYYKSEIFGHEI